jgi:hypothetical protein
VVGADRKDPNDKLEEGPRVGNQNALAPGWKVDDKGIHQDPKDRIGGATDRSTKQEP